VHLSIILAIDKLGQLLRLITDVVVTPSVNMNQEMPDETRHVLARH